VILILPSDAVVTYIHHCFTLISPHSSQVHVERDEMCYLLLSVSRHSQEVPMKTLIIKTLAVSALSAAVLAGSMSTEAEARRRGAVGAAIVGGVVAGALIAGAASSARASEPVYVAEPRGCYDLKRRAIWYEEHGRPGRAQYFWDRYAECRGY
jgi:hypothetical protein